jgi:hypothetical protein
MTWEYGHLDEVSKKYQIIHVVPHCEADLWIKTGKSFAVVPDEWKIADIRHWIVEQFWNLDRFHVTMDDDLRLYRRIERDEPALRMQTVQDSLDMFARIEKYLKDDGYAHGAISERGGNNHYPPLEENYRALCLHFYDAKILHEEGIDHRAVIEREDYHVTLSLLELGYINAIDFEFAHDQLPNVAGGCSRYRTPKMLADAAYQLAELHPGCVRVVERNTKASINRGMSLDVRVQWKKAFGRRANERKAI